MRTTRLGSLGVSAPKQRLPELSNGFFAFIEANGEALVTVKYLIM